MKSNEEKYADLCSCPGVEWSDVLVFRSFKEAREFARSLGLKSHREWNAYSKSGKRPDDIPSDPARKYKGEGWIGMGDWLGTGRKTPYQGEYRPFNDARMFALSLGLKTQEEWDIYCKSGKRPDDIPSNPDKTYNGKGWINMGDWLGTGNIACHLRAYRSFKEARAFVHSLGLKTQEEWSEYCKSGKKPDDIPSAPHRTYKGKGWISLGDWLGTGNIACQLREYRPFKEAREFARSLELKTQEEWSEYCKSGKKPDDVPSRPNRTYKGKGWIDTGDWLGYKR